MSLVCFRSNLTNEHLDKDVQKAPNVKGKCTFLLAVQLLVRRQMSLVCFRSKWTNEHFDSNVQKARNVKGKCTFLLAVQLLSRRQMSLVCFRSKWTNEHFDRNVQKAPNVKGKCTFLLGLQQNVYSSGEEVSRRSGSWLTTGIIRCLRLAECPCTSRSSECIPNRVQVQCHLSIANVRSHIGGPKERSKTGSGVTDRYWDVSSIEVGSCPLCPM
jgi:hypothetical protein